MRESGRARLPPCQSARRGTRYQSSPTQRPATLFAPSERYAGWRPTHHDFRCRGATLLIAVVAINITTIDAARCSALAIVKNCPNSIKDRSGARLADVARPIFSDHCSAVSWWLVRRECDLTRQALPTRGSQDSFRKWRTQTNCFASISARYRIKSPARNSSPPLVKAL